MLRKILWGLIAGFVIIQFFRIDKTVRKADPATDFVWITNPPGEVMSLLKVACYDCHSYQTQYPWYTNVAPISWWIGHHIEEARDHLNFSIWGTYDSSDQLDLLYACADEVEKGRMPLASYTWIHGAAKLTDYQRGLLKDWFNSGQIGMNRH